MPFDLVSFAEGILASILADRAKDNVSTVIDEEILNKPQKKVSEDYLEEIHLLLVSAIVWFKHTQANQGDLYDVVTIYKSGFGPPYKPSHVNNRQHITLFSPYTPAIVLNCSGSALGSFNLTLNVADWRTIDLPDNSQYLLDATAPANQLLFWQRATNADVI